MPPDRFSEHDA